MRQTTSSIWMALWVLCVVGLGAQAARAQSRTFQGTASDVSRWLRGQPRIYRLRTISSAIFRLDQALPIARLHPKRKAMLQGIVACMASYAVELPRKRRYTGTFLRNRHSVRYELLWRKRRIARMLNHQQRLRRCQLALRGTQPWRHALAQRVSRSYLHQELRSLGKAIPALHKQLTRLEALHKQLQFKRTKGQPRLSRKAREHRSGQLIHLAKGVLLRIDALLFRREREQYSHSPSHIERIKQLRKLWELRPFKKSVQTISSTPSLAIHGASLGLVSLLAFLLAADQIKGGGLNSSQGTVSWGFLGGTLGVAAATPALLLIALPQGQGSTISISILSGVLVPTLGASLAFSRQPEAQAIGYGLLASLPVHAAWLVLGWINQARWADQRRRWKQPPPPLPTVQRGTLSLSVR